MASLIHVRVTETAHGPIPMSSPENSPKNPKITKLANKERILRVLEKICQAKLMVFITLEQGQSITIKGRALFLEIPRDKPDQFLTISNLSTKAINILKTVSEITVEFAFFSTKIVFPTNIIQLKTSEAIIRVPDELISVERRGSERIPITPLYPLFVSMPTIHHTTNGEVDEIGGGQNWEGYSQKITFPHYEHIADRIRLSDISVAGFCVESFYPFLSNSVVLDQNLEEGMIHFPLHAPLSITFRVKWVAIFKKTETKHITLSYRMGCSVDHPSQQYVATVKFFKQHTQNLKAI